MVNRTAPDHDFYAAEEDGVVPTWERAQLAVLMDIRRELRRLNEAIYCPNFMAIPHTLKRISANTAKPKKRRKK